MKRKDLNITTSEETPKKRKSKSLSDLTSSKQLQRRTDKLWDDVCTSSRNEGQDEWRILGLLLTRCQNQKACEFGNHLWNDSPAHFQVPVDNAMAILVDSSLGQQTYTNYIMIFYLHGFTWETNKLRLLLSHDDYQIHMLVFTFL